MVGLQKRLPLGRAETLAEQGIDSEMRPLPCPVHPEVQSPTDRLSRSPSNPRPLFDVTDEVRHNPCPNRQATLFQELAIVTEQLDVLGCDIPTHERTGRHRYGQNLQ